MQPPSPMITGGEKEALGAVVAVCSAGLYDLGYVIQKQALDTLPRLRVHPIHLLSTVVRSRRWVAGFLAIVIGLALQVVAFTLAPVSVVQPILAGGLLGLVALAGPMLGERLGRRQTLALACVAVSVACIAISTHAATTVASRAPVARFAALAVPVAGVSLLCSWAANRQVHPPLGLVATAAGLMYGLAAVAEKAVATSMVAHGLIAGAWSSLASAYPWLFLVATICGMAVFQFGLQRHPATLMAALTNGSGAVCAFVGASVVFGEALVPTGGWGVPRLLGFAFVLAAVTLLATERSPAQTPAPA